MRTLDVLAALQVSFLHVAACAVVGRMTAKFVLKKGSTGKYHFNLVAPKRAGTRDRRELRE
jgi:hypothetical protein